jgi:hypothetical protein
MKNSIVIGPVQKAKPTAERTIIINDRLSKMKIGNFFEVTGLSTKSEVMNFRASVQYCSKKRDIRVATTMENGILKVERVKASKTKELSKVQ